MAAFWPDLARVVTAIQDEVVDLGDEVRDFIQSVAPVGEGPTAGRLRDSLEAETESTGNGFHIDVTSDVPEAAFVKYGTPPHPIDPIDPSGYLFWEGAAHPVKHVNHPGTAPQDYPAEVQDDIDARVDEAISTAVEAAL